LLRNAFHIVFTLLVALSVGFGSAYYMVENGREMTATTYGSWFGWPETGGSDIDPYRKATLARSGALQLGRAEGVVFTATHDDAGENLVGGCTYLISGTTPSASAWTLRAMPIGPNVSDKNTVYLTSFQINRHNDGTFDITTSPDAQPGNWLSTANMNRMEFILSFYDTNAFLVVGQETTVLPALQKVSCS